MRRIRALRIAAGARAAGALYLTVFLGFPAAAQVEAPAASAPSAAPAATGAARAGGGFAGPPGGTSQPWGPFAPGVPGAPLAPDSAGRGSGFGLPFGTIGAQPTGQPTRGWTITPSLGITQTYNDNIRFTPRNKQDEFITNLNAGLALGVDTARLQGSLRYAAGYNLYANESDRNGLTGNGAGQFLFTLLPDTFFISASGQANTQPFGSALNPQADTRTQTGNLVQTYSFQVSPYAVHRFGGTATAFTGYVYRFVDQNSVARRDIQTADPIEQILQQRANTAGASFTSHQAYIGARTGEDFGRLAMQGTLSGTWFEGNGLYDGAYRHLGLVETRYAFTRGIAGLVELGYERERFNTFPVTEIDGPVWAVGTRLTPNPDSLIIVKYGRRNGFNSWEANGNWAVGVRTRLFGTYRETLTTSALSAGDLLSSTTLDPLGNPVDAQTGAPVLPGLASQTIGAQGVLFRQKQATAGISQTWTRDTFSLTATYSENTPFGTTRAAAAAGAGRTSIETTSFRLAWTRDVAPVTSLTVFGSYAFNTTTTSTGPQQGSRDFNSANVGASLGHSLTPTLAGVLSYQLNWRDSTTGQFGSGEAVQNIFTAGLRQSF
jgi:uncharacterized protein (PEP-CTERM system associated)